MSEQIRFLAPLSSFAWSMVRNYMLAGSLCLAVSRTSSFLHSGAAAAANLSRARAMTASPVIVGSKHTAKVHLAAGAALCNEH